MSELKKFDHLLDDEGPAALVLRQQLQPVEGKDGVIFPATYAAAEEKGGFPGGYNIDSFPDGSNVCIIDSVGSQANRIEPMFKEAKYKNLVPQVSIQAGNREISILEAGHRAGDAIVRCSALQKDLQDAFKAALNGNHEPLAKIAPTSLVFGVWDSRDTQAKLPRLVSSTVRAYNVRKLTRSAQYIPAARYTDEGLLEAPADKSAKEYSKRGFLDAPATASHGGVIADGGITREAILVISALKLLRAGDDEKRTATLRRYILGLALVALTQHSMNYLRQGCLLVLDPDPKKPNEFAEVYPDGARKKCGISHEQALTFATAAAEEFGVGPSKSVPFDVERAKRDLLGEGDTKTKPKKTKKLEPA